MEHRIILELVFAIGAIIALFLIVQGVNCHIALLKSRKRLSSYKSKTAHLSYGDMTYVDKGQGEVILSSHGLFGGFDQACDICKSFNYAGRIIAPSRFGYLGSDRLGVGTPSEQVAAYIELLDKLNIEKVYVLGASAGGTVAIRFALDCPERTKGLILYCSAMPFLEKPKKYPKYAGPPPFLVNNYGMFITSPLFQSIMGISSSTINTMLPIDKRKVGVLLDASITNPDMARNFDNYQIENLQMPSIIFHAKDDKVVIYNDMQNLINRFPDCTFVPFENGGHMIVGHSEEIGEHIKAFIESSVYINNNSN